MNQRMLVWDFPTRIFHWLLVISFTGAFLTSESDGLRDVHLVLGYTLLGLIAFRLVWGIVGTRYAQFRSFLFGPREIAGYISSLLAARPKHYAGHNPAGSLSVFALLGLGLASGISGVLLLQDFGGEALEELHEACSYGMLVVVAIHIGGVLVSSVLHKENLVRAMVTGYKPGQPEEGIRPSHAWLGIILLLAVIAFWIGYPSTGLIPPNDGTAQGQRYGGDDDD